MPGSEKEENATPTLHEDVEQIRTPDGWISVYQWRTGVWYMSVAGQVARTLSGVDLGIAENDGLVRRFPRCRDQWRLQWTEKPGVPLHVYCTTAGLYAAVIPADTGRVRAETIAAQEDLAIRVTIRKSNKMRRLCREAESRFDGVLGDG